MEHPAFIGTAAWSIPPRLREQFPEGDSILARYAGVFRAVEINSSFYRDHKPETYARWAGAVPKDFRFSVKLSREFTQGARLTETGARLREVLRGIEGLGDKWAVLLVQLPPSLDFELRVAERFMGVLREYHSGTVFWEPRHVSWAAPEARSLMAKHEMGKVSADPERCPLAAARMPTRMRYFRLHGSPEIYKSSYGEDALAKVAAKLIHTPEPSWCIFDNTTFGFATDNALSLRARLSGRAGAYGLVESARASA